MTTISQKSLQAILKMRQRAATLAKELDAAETAIFESLKDGATVQNGLLAAEIKKRERRNVAWRQVCEREIDKRDGEGTGFKLAERILAATKPDKYEKLIVELACKRQHQAAPGRRR